MNTKNFTEITKETLEEEVGKSKALNIWKKYNVRKKPPEKPALVLMAGYPLSGKSTLAQEMERECPNNTVIVESDKIRTYVAEIEDYKVPKYTIHESLLTFNICHELIRIGLSNSVNVIFDATNLQEQSRFGSYLAAEEYDAPIAVVLVEAPIEIMTERFEASDTLRKKALLKLSETNFTKVTGKRTLIKVNSSHDPYTMLQAIKGLLPIKVMDETMLEK